MGEFPRNFILPDQLATVHTAGLASVGSTPILAAGFGSVAWPSANLAIFVPFRLTRPMVITKLFVQNGGTVSGNIDLGIYDASGTKIVSTGSTAQAGTNGTQSIAVTSTELGPGLYYLAIALDNTTGQVFRFTFSVCLDICKALGLAQQASAFALPANATFATIANNIVPVIGCSGRSTL
jgi:hypothetical protein